MHVHALRRLSTWPGKLNIVLGAQLSNIIVELLPPPSVGLACIGNTQTAIALDPSGDQEMAIACDFPDCFRTLPAIKQNVCKRPWCRFKVLDRLDHQIDLALEGDLLARAHRLLPIETRSGWASLSQKHIEPLDQAMASYSLCMGR